MLPVSVLLMCNPPACRHVWLEGVVLVSVLGLCLFLCSLAPRFCFVWIKVTPLLPLLPLLLLLLLLLRLLRRVLRLLYSFPFFPKCYTGSAGSWWCCLQHYRRLQVLVTGRARYWSTSTHWVCVPLVVQARTCYSSCFWALSSSLLLSGFHLAWTSTSLGAISLRFHPVSFHAAVCCQARGSYIVPGATLLGAVLFWYTVNRLLQQILLQKPLPFYGLIFVFLSYSSSSSPSFLFCSLAGFHLECTSNSLGATSLWSAGLPKANK